MLQTLQCCVGIYHTTMQISRNYTYITSLLSLPPLPDPRSSQSTRLGSLCYIATSHQLSFLHMAAYICKMVLMSPFRGQKWRHRLTEQTCGHGGGRRGWDKLREKHGNTYITICIASRNLLYDAGSSTRCSVTT